MILTTVMFPSLAALCDIGKDEQNANAANKKSVI